MSSARISRPAETSSDDRRDDFGNDEHGTQPLLASVAGAGAFAQAVEIRTASGAQHGRQAEDESCDDGKRDARRAARAMSTDGAAAIGRFDGTSCASSGTDAMAMPMPSAPPTTASSRLSVIS